MMVLADPDRKAPLKRVLEAHLNTLKDKNSIKSHWPREIFKFMFHESVYKRLFLGEVPR